MRVCVRQEGIKQQQWEEKFFSLSAPTGWKWAFLLEVVPAIVLDAGTQWAEDFKLEWKFMQVWVISIV